MSASRRNFLRAVAGAGALAGAGGLAGCIDDSGTGGDGSPTPTGNGGGGGGGATVAAGPGGDLVFEPEEVTVSTGETVTWEFASPGHNVSAIPEHSDEVSLPDGAEPFGSMGQGGDKFETVAEGETYEHTFETAGEYQYVCVPHVSAGMIGRVVVQG